jgi:hypothetical protein
MLEGTDGQDGYPSLEIDELGNSESILRKSGTCGKLCNASFDGGLFRKRTVGMDGEVVTRGLLARLRLPSDANAPRRTQSATEDEITGR